jgi:LAO/AO transport system kinase
MGDEIQAIKAGLLEVADLVVVNKGDRPGAHRTAAQLRAMLVPPPPAHDPLSDAGEATPAAVRPMPKRPEVLVTTAMTGEGVPELVAALDRHRATVGAGGTPTARRKRAEAQVRAILVERLWERLRAPGAADAVAEAIDGVARHHLDPYAAADGLLAALAGAGAAPVRVATAQGHEEER